jgi:exodeoxyribonuclease VIII
MTAPLASLRLTFADYCAVKAVNWSTLKHMDRSPLHYLHARENNVPETDPMRLGRAVHTLVLEPDLFDVQYTVWTKRRQGKEWDAFEAENTGRTILTAEQNTRAHGIAASILRHPIAREYLSIGRAERSMIWTDPVTGLKCKARADFLSPRAVVDLKTYADLSPRAFESATFRMGYMHQLSHYRNGAMALDLYAVEPDAVIIGAESKAPYDVGVFVLDTESMTHGATKVAELLAKVKECTDSGNWPGRYPDQQAYQLPEWARQAPDITFEEEE